jgi:basic amino acid/polyamine antiporter, APA family
MTENEGLKREIGLWGLVANSVNIIVGAGIFMLPVIVAERLGSASISAYAVCGGLMILIMLCFAEAGSKITLTGGAYTYIETAFGRFAGFITANIFIFGAAVTANAAVANGLADTLSYFFPLFDQRWLRIVFFALMFGGFAFFNVRGVKNAIFIVKFNTIAKLLPLLMIVTLGWLFIEPTDLKFTLGDPLNDLGEITLVLLFAFVGAETALNVSGEIRRPERTIPAGIMLSILFVVVLYILIQVVVQAILGDSITLHRNAPIAETANIMFGVTGATIVVIGAVFSMFGNISGMVLNMPRILFAAARDRVIPLSALSLIHPVFRTPHVSVIIYAILGFIFASMGEFRQLAMLSSASYMLIYLGVVLAVIKFRLTNSFKSKGILTGYIIPLISAGIIIWVLTKLPLNELTGMAIFILLLAVVYSIIRITGKHKPTEPN